MLLIICCLFSLLYAQRDDDEETTTTTTTGLIDDILNNELEKKDTEKSIIVPYRIKENRYRYETTNLTTIGILYCVDEEDLYRLLYTICIRSILCREVYYLDESNDRNFDKFMRQLSLIKLFNQNEPNFKTEDLFITQIWPSEWCPYYTVQYQSTDYCSQSAPPSLTFVYAAMDMMMTYKQFISNEHYCNDHNERLIWDGSSFRCICRRGRTCHNDARTNAYITLLVVMVIGLFFLLILMSFYNTTTFFM